MYCCFNNSAVYIVCSGEYGYTIKEGCSGCVLPVVKKLRKTNTGVVKFQNTPTTSAINRTSK